MICQLRSIFQQALKKFDMTKKEKNELCQCVCQWTNHNQLSQQFGLQNDDIFTMQYLPGTQYMTDLSLALHIDAIRCTQHLLENGTNRLVNNVKSSMVMDAEIRQTNPDYQVCMFLIYV